MYLYNCLNVAILLPSLSSFCAVSKQGHNQTRSTAEKLQKKIAQVICMEKKQERKIRICKNLLTKPLMLLVFYLQSFLISVFRRS